MLTWRQPPSAATCTKYLREIAAAFQIPWTATIISATEEEEQTLTSESSPTTGMSEAGSGGQVIATQHMCLWLKAGSSHVHAAGPCTLTLALLALTSFSRSCGHSGNPGCDLHRAIRS